MKINSKVLPAIFLAAGIAIGSCGAAFSDITSKVAVVDVPSVIAKKKKKKKLKEEQDKKAQELNKWLETVNADIKKQSTDANRQKLLKKYNDELAKKKEANAKDYTAKLSEIDKNITSTIAAQAKAKGYTLVLSKSSVLYGGDDITAEISKAVK